VVEARFPELCETQPELLAHHYTEADMLVQAIPYWQRAGQRAIERSANVEAISHLSKGLALLTLLPDTVERTQHELDFLTTLGPVLASTKGYAAPEVVQAYTRARELCQQVGETPEHFPVLWNLFLFYLARAEPQTAMELGEQCLQLAQRVQDAALLLEAHLALGVSWFYLGNPALACSHLEQTITLYDPQQHHVLAYRYGGIDPGISGFGHYAWALWLHGYPAQARAHSAKALSLAQQLTHPFTLARTLYYDTILGQLRRDAPDVRDQADAAITVATGQGFALGGILDAVFERQHATRHGVALAPQCTCEPSQPRHAQPYPHNTTVPRDDLSGCVGVVLETSAIMVGQRCLSKASRHLRRTRRAESTQTGGCDPVAHRQPVPPYRVGGQWRETSSLRCSLLVHGARYADRPDTTPDGRLFDRHNLLYV
jgi:tetratricopeptide (TPR) repeat protein